MGCLYFDFAPSLRFAWELICCHVNSMVKKFSKGCHYGKWITVYWSFISSQCDIPRNYIWSVVIIFWKMSMTSFKFILQSTNDKSSSASIIRFLLNFDCGQCTSSIPLVPFESDHSCASKCHLIILGLFKHAQGWHCLSRPWAFTWANKLVANLLESLQLEDGAVFLIWVASSSIKLLLWNSRLGTGFYLYNIFRGIFKWVLQPWTTPPDPVIIKHEVMIINRPRTFGEQNMTGLVVLSDAMTVWVQHFNSGRHAWKHSVMFLKTINIWTIDCFLYIIIMRVLHHHAFLLSAV